MPGLESIQKDLPELLCAALIAILFIQSGLDKLLDWSGSLSYLKDHFSKTFVAGTVPIMLGIITLIEITTGLLSAAGVVYLIVTSSTSLIYYGAITGALTIIALFFGQRIAKDYPGAAVLIPYFLLLIATLVLSSETAR
jgi:uncharacterized membrane protein YphA (DoxX/SURF4 family)